MSMDNQTITIQELKSKLTVNLIDLGESYIPGFHYIEVLSLETPFGGGKDEMITFYIESEIKRNLSENNTV